MNILFRILIIIAITSNMALGQNQDQENRIFDTTAVKKYSHNVIAKLEKGKVILRWAPTDYVFWELGNTSGYTIEKMALKADPFTNPDALSDEELVFTKIAGMPMMPWTVEQFKANIKDTTNTYLGVAMEMLYGEVGADGDISSGVSLQQALLEQQNKHSFALMAADLNTEAAKSLGLRYEDTDVKDGMFYVYRIYFNGSDPEVETDTIEIFIDKSKITPQQAVTNCMVEAFDKEVKLLWTSHNSAYFSAFDIERSGDKKLWTKLNAKPYVSSSINEGNAFIYFDTSVVNSKIYHYRLRGYTPFGEMGLYSEIMTTTPKDLTPPTPAFGIKAKDQGGAVMITWDAFPTESDHDGFYVGRSYLASGGFEKISAKLKKEERAFLDLQPDFLENNYYAVISVDKSGNEAISYVALGYVVDSLPPTPPTGLAGVIDTTGFVRISWDRGPEADIIGYRVYWANDTLSEFSQLTGDVLSHTVFYDSVNVKTLSEFAFYKVVAVDHRYNHSKYSKILSLQKPDLVPPAAPVITKYNQEQLSVNFSWVNSVSDDVVKHRLERKVGDEEWKEIKTFVQKEKQWTDKELTAGKAYSYRVVAIDDADNITYSKLLEITAIDRGLRDDVENLKIVSKDGKSFLEWKYKNVNNAIFVVYKQNIDKKTYEPIARLSNAEQSYQIHDLSLSYGVRVMYSDGGESKLLTTN